MVPATSHSSEEVDRVLSALSDRRARAVCRYFHAESAETATVEDLVRFVRDQIEREVDEYSVKLDLHHATLPKLADAGFVDYDAREKEIQYDGSELLEACFDRVLETNHVAV
jgi:hypothetical protein